MQLRACLRTAEFITVAAQPLAPVPTGRGRGSRSARTADVPCVVAASVAIVVRRFRIALGRRIRVAGHAVEGQRVETVGTGGVQVHLLAEPVHVEQQRPRPAVGQRRERRRVEADRDLIAWCGDDESIVARRQQRRHVAEPRIQPRHRLPGRLRRHAVVVEPEWLPAVRGRLGRVAAPAQGRALWVEASSRRCHRR
jgi:hypothetical protein